MEFDYECVKLEQHDGISWLAPAREKERHSPQLYEMDEALARLEGDPETKLVVLTGSGGNFSAGQDLDLFFRALEDKPAEIKRAQEAANRWRFERLELRQTDHRHDPRVLRRRRLYATAVD